ncbi:hypothetical protein I4F81_005039 [Pyropia yezoensis]|uniref:Uncharacterized protein n=1 Tax=Pyropia yezoensis TaxID=2788 RepID=A0ACC3BWQ7_PYRYE|nr:hypothetical protein I4F81_005039 [Neopyropia yezoensis]
MAGESSINPLRNQTPLTTFSRNLRKKEVFPFAIGFASVLLLSGYFCRVTEEDYKTSINKGFRGPPFVKSASADQH